MKGPSKAGRCPMLNSRARPCSPRVTSVQGGDTGGQDGQVVGRARAPGGWATQREGRVPSGARKRRGPLRRWKERGDVVVMAAHRSTENGVAPCLIHGCRAPPHSTPAKMLGPRRARAHHRGLPSFPHSLSSILHSPHENPCSAVAVTWERWKACLQSRELRRPFPTISRYPLPTMYAV